MSSIGDGVGFLVELTLGASWLYERFGLVPWMVISIVWKQEGGETLRVVSFGEPEASKPYAQCGLGT